MNDAFVEKYYEEVVLPLYKDSSIRAARWKDHGKVGLDTYAHYFEDKAGVEFVLLNEDFPGSEYLNDNLTHDKVQAPNFPHGTIRVVIGEVEIPNVTGYFTLYKERS